MNQSSNSSSESENSSQSSNGNPMGPVRKVIRSLASLKFAVVIILAIGVLSAWGTIVEAQYNSRIAQKTVYHSIYMVVTLLALCVSLIAVIIDRYPWKKHHLGFILAHVGIIVLLVGSVITQKYGIDGSLPIGVNESGEFVQLPETDVIVWATFDGDSFAKIFEQEVDFYSKPPSEENPLVVPLADAKLEFVDYIPFAFEERKTVATDKPEDGPALRFQLQNDNVNVSEWLRMEKANGSPSVLEFGPAKVVLHRGNYAPTGENEILLTVAEDGNSLDYRILSKREGVAPRMGRVKAGETIETGWMGLNFRLLKFMKNAKEEASFIPLKYPTEKTRAAVKVRFQDEERWIALGSVVRFFTKDSGYTMAFANRRVSIGFQMKLVKFKMAKYPGTQRAASYASDVDVPGLGVVNISMNEPLKYKGLTFYQASFQNDEATGEPIASVFSVNRDPGRFWKYLGSALIVLGTIVMFYFRRLLADLYRQRQQRLQNEKRRKSA